MGSLPLFLKLMKLVEVSGPLELLEPGDEIMAIKVSDTRFTCPTWIYHRF